MSLNVLEMKKMSWNVLEWCKMSWKVLEINSIFRKFRFIWNLEWWLLFQFFEIWNSLYIFRENFLEINSKMSWKVLEMIQDIWVGNLIFLLSQMYRLSLIISINIIFIGIGLLSSFAGFILICVYIVSGNYIYFCIDF